LRINERPLLGVASSELNDHNWALSRLKRFAVRFIKRRDHSLDNIVFDFRSRSVVFRQ
jgi:hypothetical protein